MATEERLIYANEALWRLRMLKESKIDDPFFGGKRNTIWDLALNSAISRVEDCPTVDAVEVVHGYWEKGKKPNWQMPMCSACKAQATTRSSYCPHCGAKMDGEDNA